MYLIFLLFSLDSAPVWQIGETEIYETLGRDRVVITEDERVFLLYAGEHRIFIFDKGQPVGSFGKQGQGPGEMMFPQKLFLEGERLFVNDFMNKVVIVFDLDGNYVDQIRVQEMPGYLAKIRGGWVSGKWMSFGKEKDPGQLLWADERFENERVILDMRPEGFEPPDGTFSLQLGKPVPMNPAPEGNVMTVSEDGKRIFLARPGPKLVIHVFDHEGKPITEIRKDWQQLPFDEEWGQSRIDQMNSGTQRGNFKVEWEGDFPDVFPHVRAMVSFGNRLYVHRWRAWPKENPLVSVLDFSGAEQSSELPARAIARVVTVRGEDAYVLTFDAEEENAGLAKLKLGEVAAFVDANPIGEVAGGGITIIQ